jgi:acylphosphatase
MIRKTAIYSGRVQGVGFRFTAHRAAAGFKVTGYVRNLPDGRVELVAEGDHAEVQRFADAVADRMAGYIDDVQETEGAAEGRFASFDIRH